VAQLPKMASDNDQTITNLLGEFWNLENWSWFLFRYKTIIIF